MRFLFGWGAWELTESAFWVGVVAGAMLLPALLLSPLFGIVSDRVNPRNAVLLTISAHAAVAVLAGAVNALGMLTLPWLIGLAVMLGAATSAHTPMRLALIPRLVSRQALPNAIGLSAMVFNSSRIIGPAVGAGLIATFSLSVAFNVAGFLMMLALPLLAGIGGVARTPEQHNTSFVAQLGAGIAYAASHSMIRLVLGMTLLNGLLGRTLLELLPALSGQLLDGSPETLALLSAGGGAGSIVGGLIISRQRGDEQRLLSLTRRCLLAAAASIFCLQALDGTPVLAGFVFLLSMITTMAGTGSQALAQLMVDEAYRGRVLSLWTMLAMGAPALGAVVVGALAQAWGFGTVATLVALAGAALLLRLR